jgi:hypothetical protein
MDGLLKAHAVFLELTAQDVLNDAEAALAGHR